MLLTVDKCALLLIFFHGSFYMNCCHVKKMTLVDPIGMQAIMEIRILSIINPYCKPICHDNGGVFEGLMFRLIPLNRALIHSVCESYMAEECVCTSNYMENDN